jgi:hypothetical protein
LWHDLPAPTIAATSGMAVLWIAAAARIVRYETLSSAAASA